MPRKLSVFFLIVLLAASTLLADVPHTAEATTYTKSIFFHDNFEDGTLNATAWFIVSGSNVENLLSLDGAYSLNISNSASLWTQVALNLPLSPHCYISFLWETMAALTADVNDCPIMGLGYSGDGGHLTLLANSTYGDLSTNSGEHYFPLHLSTATPYNITVSFDKDISTGLTNSTIWVNSKVNETLTDTDTYIEPDNTFMVSGAWNSRVGDTYFDDVQAYTLTVNPSPPAPTPTVLQVLTIPYTEIPRSDNYYFFSITTGSSSAYELEIVNTLTGSLYGSGQGLQVFGDTLVINNVSAGFSTFDLEYSTATILANVYDAPGVLGTNVGSNGTTDVSNAASVESFQTSEDSLIGTNAGGVPTAIGVFNQHGTLTGGSIVITILGIPVSGGGGGRGGYGNSNPTPTPYGPGGFVNKTSPLQQLLNLLKKIPPWAIWALIAILIIAGVAGIAKGNKKTAAPSRSFSPGAL